MLNENARGQLTGLLEGRKCLVFGVANNRSIAWAIAKSCHDAGAKLALTYQNDVTRKRVIPLAQQLGAKFVLPCDVENPAELDAVFATIGEEWGRLDAVVHAIAFADRASLSARFADTTSRQFEAALRVSCYSLIDVARRCEKLMPNGGSIVTMTSYGSEKVLPNYNVMGVAKAALECSVRYLAADFGPHNIRVNAVSAGPVKTLSAGAIPSFNEILRWNQSQSFLRRNVAPEEIGNTAIYLLFRHE